MRRIAVCILFTKQEIQIALNLTCFFWIDAKFFEGIAIENQFNQS